MLARLECEAGRRRGRRDDARAARARRLGDRPAQARLDDLSLRSSPRPPRLLADRERASQSSTTCSLPTRRSSRWRRMGSSRWVPCRAMWVCSAAVLSRLDEAARRLEDAAAANATIGARPWVAHAKADHARVLLTRQAPGRPRVRPRSPARGARDPRATRDDRISRQGRRAPGGDCRSAAARRAAHAAPRRGPAPGVNSSVFPAPFAVSRRRRDETRPCRRHAGAVESGIERVAGRRIHVAAVACTRDPFALRCPSSGP